MPGSQALKLDTRELAHDGFVAHVPDAGTTPLAIEEFALDLRDHQMTGQGAPVVHAVGLEAESGDFRFHGVSMAETK